MELEQLAYGRTRAELLALAKLTILQLSHVREPPADRGKRTGLCPAHVPEQQDLLRIRVLVRAVGSAGFGDGLPEEGV